MMSKLTLLVFVAVVFIASLAVAQETQPLARMGAEEGQPAPRAVLGWNAIRPALCFLTASGLMLVEGTDTSIWFLLTPGANTAVSPACSAGSPVWFHVVDLAGTVDGIATFPR